MDLKRTTYTSEIMLLIAKTLSVHNVSCVHQTTNGIVKSWLDENLQVHDDGKVSIDDVNRRKTPTTKRTSWETTSNRDSMLFEDQSLTLCLRIPSPIDNQYDIYFATIRPTLGSLSLMVSDHHETQVSIRDKEIIATICYNSCMALISILKQKDEKTQMLLDYIKHKDRTISELKRQNEIPFDRTMKLVREKLFALGRKYGKEFLLSKDAEAMVYEYVGADISPLLKALEVAVSTKVDVYGNSQITLNDDDIWIVHNNQAETESARPENVIEKRHAKYIAYLERIEDAFIATVESGERPTAVNVAKKLGISSASITMWFNKHSEDARRLCEEDVNLCKNSRLNFEPLKEALAGRKNKSNTA